VIETLKSLSGRAYDPQAKEWNFPVELHNEAIKKLHAIPGVEAKPLPTTVIKALSAESAAPPSSQSPQKDVAESMKRLPEHLANALMPFQQEVHFPNTGPLNPEPLACADAFPARGSFPKH
jgi:hypothetical protein